MLVPLGVVAGVHAGARLAHQLLVHQRRRLQRQRVLAQQLEALVQRVRQRGPQQRPQRLHHAVLAPAHLHEHVRASGASSRSLWAMTAPYAGALPT